MSDNSASSALANFAGDDPRADEIKALARDHAEDMIAVLAEVAMDRDAKSAARVQAAKHLLERGFGAPERKVEQRVDVNVHDHRQAHIAVLRKLADKNNPVEIIDAEFKAIEHKPEDKSK